MKKIALTLLISFASISLFAQEINFKKIEEQLKAGTLIGWVHGSSSEHSLFVFTWRDPDNFFVNFQFPMVHQNPEILKRLQTLGRHDRVRIQGSFLRNGAPLQHLLISDFEMDKKWTGPGHNLKYKYKAKVPSELMKESEFVGKVHIVVGNGSVLVMEYKDVVLPVVNRDPELAASLFRNDKVRLKYVVRTFPNRPAHLAVDLSKDQPIKVIDSMEKDHGKVIQLTGPIVMFPKSPQIVFDIFALRQEDSFGIRRNYTLVNFSNMEIFKKIREKLGAVWKKHESKKAYDRNKFINRKILVTAKGKKNVVHPGQANPQILLESADDISFQIIE